MIKESGMQISELFNIKRRFLRLTHLERDFGDSTCLDGYVVTPHVRESICRINAGLGKRSSLRSWRITGDYGSGKSSFAILLAQLYARREGELQPRLRHELSEPIRRDPKLGSPFPPCPRQWNTRGAVHCLYSGVGPLAPPANWGGTPHTVTGRRADRCITGASA